MISMHSTENLCGTQFNLGQWIGYKAIAVWLFYEWALFVIINDELFLGLRPNLQNKETN